MMISTESLDEVIKSSYEGDNDGFGYLIKNLKAVCNSFGDELSEKITQFLSEEYGITNDRQLRLASLDVEVDLAEFINSQTV
ncbi:hypothetical protein SAMN05216249_101184 [Acetitomaculum ruminis DSM 5522]|uniref:Uncharacterized protein n=1 Tax=Acetitomaculum ruminis DSM 5522 TaxID=1120918 RepID=A0A1I0V6C7_9FIRM|nr:hypothetical protein [Acetitomaculum ruminis]SFA71802.1 hypothetical protein SAMN05216249_101184 [Acetitomaculum ruminis DSM 5522]